VIITLLAAAALAQFWAKVIFNFAT
jgi:hypothetical protein